MSVREQIMALDAFYNSALQQAANLAEARERELLDAMGLLEGIADNLKVEHAQMIAELVGALKLNRKELDGLPHSLGYDFTHIPAIDAVINKFETVK